MKAVVISHGPRLLPFAWRLLREGTELKTYVLDPRASRCWSGRMDVTLRDPSQPLEDDAVLVTDSPDVQLNGPVFGQFRMEPIPTAMRIGSWFDGQSHHAPHLLFYDMGAWPGRLGAPVPGGLTSARLSDPLPPVLEKALDAVTETLREASFRGLVQVGLDDRLQPKNYIAGWAPLHPHCFFSDCPSVSEVLEGQPPVLAKKFTVAVPVSVPPWPMTMPGEPVRVFGGWDEKLNQCEPFPSAKTSGRTFFHDVEVKEGNQVWTTGYDGLVGVCRGSADWLPLARQRAYEAVNGLRMEAMQFRSDVGQVADALIGAIEDVGITL